MSGYYRPTTQNGYNLFDVLSAMQKAIRRSDAAKDQADAEYLQRKWGKYISFVNRGSVVGIHIGVPRRQPGVPYARIGGERS